MGGGKINFPFNYLKEVEINGDNDGESGGSENSGGFDLDAFKQDIVDNFNKLVETPITTDNVIMPDAFIMNKNFNSGIPIPNFIDTDLTQFLASCCLGFSNVFPLYLRDSFDENNFYFGNYRNTFKLGHHIEFNIRNFDDMPDNSYSGNLDLSNYVNLADLGLL